ARSQRVTVKWYGGIHHGGEGDRVPITVGGAGHRRHKRKLWQHGPRAVGAEHRACNLNCSRLSGKYAEPENDEVASGVRIEWSRKGHLVIAPLSVWAIWPAINEACSRRVIHGDKRRGRTGPRK